MKNDKREMKSDAMLR